MEGINLPRLMAKIHQPLGRIKGSWVNLKSPMEAANARVIAFGASTGAIYAVSTAIREMVRATIEVEKTLADINVILGATQSNLESFGNTIFHSKCNRSIISNCC